jgi:hypothetical protein
MCGNTRLLPQRINIGPDRVVDKAHGLICLDLLQQMGAGGAPISPASFATYKAKVIADMTLYAQRQTQKENFAVAEAALIYVATLGEKHAPTEVRSQGKASRVIQTRSVHSVEVWNTIVNNARGDFYGYSFEKDQNADISMLISAKVK